MTNFQGFCERAQVNDAYVLNGANFSVSTTEHRIYVPAGRVKWLFSCTALQSNAAGSNIIITVYDELNRYVALLANRAAVADGIRINVPDATAGELQRFPYPLKAGWYIQFLYSAAQGALAQINVDYVEA